MSMSETSIEGRDTKGRFVAGNGGNGGRRPGARNKLGESFIADLRDVWESHGKQALIDCAQTEPAQFVRVLASLMPKDINLSVAVDAGEFASTFRAALQMLGNQDAVLPRRKPMRVLNGR